MRRGMHRRALIRLRRRVSYFGLAVPLPYTIITTESGLYLTTEDGKVLIKE